MIQKATVTRLHSEPASRFCALFGGARANGYAPATMRKDANGKVRPEAHRWIKRLTTVLWNKHLSGELGLGIIPPGVDGKILFGALDVDAYDDNEVDTREVVEQIYREKLPLIPVRTKSGGLHLLLFATEPVEPELMELALCTLAVRLHLKLKEAGGKTEIITTANLWMPYLGGDKSERCGVKPAGFMMSAVEFLHNAERARLSPDAISELATSPRKTNGAVASSVIEGARHAERQLARYCAELATMRDGEGRNTYLNKALHEMGRMIRAAWIARDKVEHDLKQVADSIGMDPDKTENLIRRRNSPIDRGMMVPPPNIVVRDAAFEPVMVCVADVPPEEVAWLWRGRIALGKLTIIGGHPGISKSTLTIDMAARVTVGGEWPCGEGTAPQGSVVMVTSEDEVGDTIHPRLAAAGADVRRVHVLKGMRKADGISRRGFDLTSDIAALEAAVRELGDVVMIIIDPVTAYMGKPGKLDSYRVTDVRAMFEPLQDMAARCGAAVVGINHLSKGGSAEALMRFLGSIGMVATSRASYLVARDKENPDRRLFLPAKNNLGDDRTGFAFKVSMKSTGYEKPPYAIAIDWEAETVSITADEALAAESNASDGRRSESAETAKKVISEMLRDGPRPAIEFDKRARELAISDKSMRTAKKALGVRTSKKGKGGWEWYLPRQAQRDLPMGAPSGDVL